MYRRLSDFTYLHQSGSPRVPDCKDSVPSTVCASMPCRPGLVCFGRVDGADKVVPDVTSVKFLFPPLPFLKRSLKPRRHYRSY